MSAMASDGQNEKTSIRLNDIAGGSNQDITEDQTDTNQNIKNGYEDLSHDDQVPLDAIDEAHDLSARAATIWRYSALATAWASVIVLLVLGIISFGISGSSRSPAAFGFGFDCILDVLTSAVVIWRFYGSIGTLYSSDRERIALLLLGCFFIVASLSIFARSVTDLVSQQHPKHGYPLFILAAVSVAACSILAIAKFIIAMKLKSKSVRTDGYSSLAGAITSFSILITTKLIERDRNIWYLDAIVGIAVGFLLLFYGVKVLIDVLNENPFSVKEICCKKCCKD
ncbi:transmembrane protein 163a-like [Amphiura filiformis]|uniref:transmembrane protein 163a-like n=1 Tax=Amphiura filiformis TaxID=82378 RepID=UPI003B20E3F0